MASVAELFCGEPDRKWQSDVTINASSGLGYGQLRVCGVNNCCREAHQFSGLTRTSKFESGLRTDFYSAMGYPANLITREWILNSAGYSSGEIVFTPDECARGFRLEDGNVILSVGERRERKNADHDYKCVTPSFR